MLGHSFVHHWKNTAMCGSTLKLKLRILKGKKEQRKTRMKGRGKEEREKKGSDKKRTGCWDTREKLVKDKRIKMVGKLRQKSG